MEFLNLGWMEIILILILAFIFLGPDKMVSTGKQIGSWLRKLSRDKLFREVVETTDEIRRYPRKIFDESGLNLPLHVEQQKLQDQSPAVFENLTENQEDKDKPD